MGKLCTLQNEVEGAFVD
jgi:hypothetical protein